MRKCIYYLCILLTMSGCGDSPVAFTDDALNESLITLNGEQTSLKSVLDNHKGKKVLIDVWASWCGDCIKGLPIVAALQKEHPHVDFLFLSVDRNETAWKRGIQRYGISGAHYFLPDGQDGAFGDFLNSNWIPRYIIVNEQGDIALFKAKKATDTRIKEILQ